jgi:hypothetical protein
MKHESVVAELDERQCSETIEGILRRHVRQHRPQERERRSANDGGGIKGRACPRVKDPEVEFGQALDDRLDRHGLEADIGPLGQRGGGESKGQRMASCKSVDPVRRLVIQAVIAE